MPRHSPYTLSSLTIRNSTYAENFEPSTCTLERRPPREPYAHCVCVVGKTTVCRIFSCQRLLRSGLRPSRFRSRLAGPQCPTPLERLLFGGRGALSPGPPWLTRSWDPFAPLRSFALSVADQITSGDLEPAGCSRAGPLTARRAGATQCRA